VLIDAAAKDAGSHLRRTMRSVSGATLETPMTKVRDGNSRRKAVVESGSLSEFLDPLKFPGRACQAI
jgi:hypothetical protein